MPLIIIFSVYLSLIILSAWLAGKAGKDRAFALAISFIFPVPAFIVYAFMYLEFKKKGKAEFKLK